MLTLLAATQATWTLVCGGDVMSNSVPVSAQPFRSISTLIRAADVAIANLEIPLTNVGTRTPRKSAESIRRRTQFVLKGDPRHAEGLKEAGFDMVSLGNNHAMDFQAGGLRQMFKALDQNEIAHTGAGETSREAYRPAVFTLPSGFRVGMISALCFVDRSSLWACTPSTPTSAGIAVINSSGGVVGKEVRAKLKSWAGSAAKECDFLIVALHWGMEKQTLPTPYQVALGRAFVDAGADLVFGHHPHVLQGAEMYKNRPILYSLGNLLSPLPSDTGLVSLQFDGEALKSARFHGARIGGGKVTLSAGKAAAAGVSRFKKLCEAVSKRYPSKQSQPFVVGEA